MAQGSSTDPNGGARRLGPYEIHAGLSVGGMAELYLASFSGPGGYRKFVALKKILSDVQSHDRFARMFQDEARITAALSHSNIAQVHDLGAAEDELYLAMEFILGLDLARVLRMCRKREQALPIGLAVRVMRDVCLALDYAHRFTDAAGQPAPVVHRDITPKNVMVTYDGLVKVIDFGVAQAKNKLDVTAVGTIKGTVAYMSPEQAQGKRVDGRSDLYSAGVVLHELLTGQRLLSGKTELEIFKQLLSGPLPSPRALNPAIPEPLAAVVQRALARDPLDRYATGQQMAEALQAAAREHLFGTEQLRAFMCSTFSDKLTESRALLKLATGEGEDTERRQAGGRRSTGEHPRPDASRAAKGVTLLAVDGTAQRLQRLQAALRLGELQVIPCGSALEALETLRTVRPDLILIATDLPRINGFELSRRLREGPFRRHLPILFMSRDCTLEERTQGLQAGGDDFVRLPFEPGELANRVLAHLQRAALMRELLTPRPSPAPGRPRA